MTHAKRVFVLSTGRTGTTALAAYLDACFEGVRALHEPVPSRRLRVASNTYLAGRLSRRAMVRLLKGARHKLYGSIDAPVVVESNPYLNGFLDAFDAAYDAPRVVHITRDPRTYVRSALNFGAEVGWKRIFNRYVPYWMIKPEQLDPATELRWAHMDSVERFAWFWSATNAHLDRGAELLGERYLRVRFEDLLAPDGQGIRELGEWIGLREIEGRLEQMLARKVNPSTRNEMSAWSEWEERDRETLLRLCGEGMRRYGYDP